jgi:hypothetical protein
MRYETRVPLVAVAPIPYEYWTWRPEAVIFQFIWASELESWIYRYRSWALIAARSHSLLPALWRIDME